MSKIETEKQTIEAMIRLYCKGKRHGETENYEKDMNCPSNPSNLNNLNNLSSQSTPTTPTTPISPIPPIPANRSSSHPLTPHRSPLTVPPLCPQCQELLTYAHQRLERCKFGNEKPSCTRCPVHCYKPAMRQQIRQVMRYSGPRMLLYNPVLAIRHLWDLLCAKLMS